MAKRTITVDDLTGRETDTSEVKVTVGGKSATLDLSPASLEALTALLEGNGPEAFASIFRAPQQPVRASKTTRVGGSANPLSRSTTSGGSGRTAEQLASIRSWAKDNGLQVADKGRIAQDVQDKYDAAH